MTSDESLNRNNNKRARSDGASVDDNDDSKGGEGEEEERDHRKKKQRTTVGGGHAAAVAVEGGSGSPPAAPAGGGGGGRIDKLLRTALDDAKREFEEKRDKVLAVVPRGVKDAFGQIGFSKWKPHFLPVLALSPYNVPEDPVRKQWMHMFEKVQKNNRADQMQHLVYWYGTADVSSCYSFVSQKVFKSYEWGVEQGHDKVPASIQKKKDNKKKLTALEESIVLGLREMKEDLKKEPADRRRGVIEFKEGYELLTTDDVENVLEDDDNDDDDDDDSELLEDDSDDDDSTDDGKHRSSASQRSRSRRTARKRKKKNATTTTPGGADGRRRQHERKVGSSGGHHRRVQRQLVRSREKKEVPMEITVKEAKRRGSKGAITPAKVDGMAEENGTDSKGAIVENGEKHVKSEDEGSVDGKTSQGKHSESQNCKGRMDGTNEGRRPSGSQGAGSSMAADAVASGRASNNDAGERRGGAPPPLRDDDRIGDLVKLAEHLKASLGRIEENAKETRSLQLRGMEIQRLSARVGLLQGRLASKEIVAVNLANRVADKEDQLLLFMDADDDPKKRSKMEESVRRAKEEHQKAQGEVKELQSELDPIVRQLERALLSLEEDEEKTKSNNNDHDEAQQQKVRPQQQAIGEEKK